MDLTVRATDGSIVDSKYWMRILPDVNKCGDRMFELYREYSNKSFLDINALEQCAERMAMIHKIYGDVIFAVNVDIFHNHLPPKRSVFKANIETLFENLPDELVMMVERLRRFNTRLQERQDQITSLLKMNVPAQSKR